MIIQYEYPKFVKEYSKEYSYSGLEKNKSVSDLSSSFRVGREMFLACYIKYVVEPFN